MKSDPLRYDIRHRVVRIRYLYRKHIRVINPILNNFLKAAKALSLDRRHNLMRKLMSYVFSDSEWAASPDVHIHMASFLEWQALDEDNYSVMRKADLSYRKAIELAPSRADILDDYITFLSSFGKQGDAHILLAFVQEHLTKKTFRELSREISLEKNCNDPEANWLRYGFPGRKPEFRARASDS